MILQSGMEHYVLKLYNVNINDDPEFTLACFTTMSFGKNYLCTRLRYQVSVYWTIDPLVTLCENKGADQLHGNRTADQRLYFRFINRSLYFQNLQVLKGSDQKHIWDRLPSFLNNGLCCI